MDGNLTINVRSSADLRFSLSIAQPGALETTIVAIKSMIKDNNGVETTAQVRPAGMCVSCVKRSAKAAVKLLTFCQTNYSPTPPTN